MPSTTKEICEISPSNNLISTFSQGNGSSNHVPLWWYCCLDVAGKCHHGSTFVAISRFGQDWVSDASLRLVVATWKGTKNQRIFSRETNQLLRETNSLERDHSFWVDSVSNDVFVVGFFSGIARISGRMFSLPKTLKRKVEVVETFQEINMNDFSKIQIIQISFFKLPLFRVKKQLIEFKTFNQCMTIISIEPFPCELLAFGYRSSGADQRKLKVLSKHLAQHTQEIKVPSLGGVNSAKTHQKTSEMVRNLMAERFLKSSEKKSRKFQHLTVVKLPQKHRDWWPNYNISPT